MTKIKKSNFVISAAAIAALIFLLPPDKATPNKTYHESHAGILMHGDTTKTNQQQPLIRGNLLHSV